MTELKYTPTANKPVGDLANVYLEFKFDGSEKPIVLYALMYLTYCVLGNKFVSIQYVVFEETVPTIPLVDLKI